MHPGVIVNSHLSVDDIFNDAFTSSALVPMVTTGNVYRTSSENIVTSPIAKVDILQSSVQCLDAGFVGHDALILHDQSYFDVLNAVTILHINVGIEYLGQNW